MARVAELSPRSAEKSSPSTARAHASTGAVATGAEVAAATCATVVRFSHGLAPADMRERLQLDESSAAELAQWLATAGAEAVVATTCSRIEAYVALRGDRLGAAADEWATALVRRGLAAVTGVAAPHLEGASESQRGVEVIQHLFRVAAGIELLAPGEGPLLPHVREAFLDALRHATSGPELNRLFRAALAAGERIRSERSRHQSRARTEAIVEAELAAWMWHTCISLEAPATALVTA